MIKLIKPTISQEEVINQCVYNLRKDKEVILNKKPLIIKIYDKYKELAENNELHKFDDPFINQNETMTNLMKKLYTDKLVGGNQQARKIYNDLKNYKEDSKNKPDIFFQNEYLMCPICHEGEVENLDHYLPKSQYPSLAINPLNLIPICNKCNRNKKDFKSKSRIENLIHLYFDDILDSNWLKCYIKFSSAEKLDRVKMDIKFKVDIDCCDCENNEILQRIQNTFEKYDVSKTYEIKAQNDFISRFDSYVTSYKEGGNEALKSEIHSAYKAFNTKNKWQNAFYSELISEQCFDSFTRSLRSYSIKETFL